MNNDWPEPMNFRKEFRRLYFRVIVPAALGIGVVASGVTWLGLVVFG